MFNKFELFGAGLSVFFMALALYLVQAEAILLSTGQSSQLAQLLQTLYQGYGSLPSDELTQKYGLTLPRELNRRNQLNCMLNHEQN